MLIFAGYTVKGDVIVNDIVIPCEVRVDAESAAEAKQYFHNQVKLNYPDGLVDTNSVRWIKVG